MAILVMFRHGQSVWNLENKFTGWVDVDLTDKGKKEAKEAGEKLKGMHFDYAYSSDLKRAQETLKIALNEAGISHVPTTYDKALNERMYGDLQGLNKADTAKKFGDEQVHIWRRSYDIAPPNGESLKDTAARVIPYFEKEIAPKLKDDKNIVIAAHGNSLRALIMFLEKMTPDEILNFEIKTGVPREYQLDKNLKVIKVKNL
ncbi:2,3-bisphosphoglycerate-dependent phosphoglycerate mutase [Apibacter adventoris]|uniref:2,3-bisphosphoglycerate-dependent phosphoglycerate mutase n=1 Tax=Apibacter adventoris TaxID=1679466 RepID=A0A2S8AG22_9FLAO|nr:2,3-diphosphoglycerate-dependent phosphoglycerate mutase [Apibacter adventoris]PQL94522.1 2,3-bisphosphoglycerate-dependent phosphoglycerate mutase [Apibacter adventoris]PQL95062.1 2,3-bisphosphoglycerate-dependent phosphoglycerate mutase [Apibacter adventoris]